MITPITPERAVFDLPTLSDATISPDGSRIAYVRAQVDRSSMKTERQVWIVNADGSGKRPLTSVGNNGQPTWSPDGTELAYVSHRTGDHPWSICLLRFDGGEPRILTSHNTSPASLVWSRDGSTIAYTKPVDPENPNEAPREPNAPAAVRVVKRIDYKQDGIGYVNDVRSQLFLLNVTSGSASGERRQVTKNLVDHVKPTLSPDGTSAAVIVLNRNGQRSQIGIVDLATGETSLHGNVDGEMGLPSWSPDGKTIIFQGDATGMPHHGIFTLDTATQTLANPIEDPEFFLDGTLLATTTPIWLDDGSVLVSASHHGASGLLTVTPATGEIGSVGFWKAAHGGLSASADGKTIVQTANDLDGTVSLVRIDRATGERTAIFDEAEEFFLHSPAAKWETVTVERGGYEIEGWLLKPADFDEAKRYPLIIDVHGGPHGAYGYGLSPLPEVLATNGFLVLRANPRGSLTYGRAFAEAVLGDWGGEDWQDLTAILDSVVARPYVDADRTGIFGYSFGGFMTSWVIGHTDRFKVAVCGAPVFDFESMFGTSDIGHSFGPEQHGGTPWEIREKLTANSPSSHIHNANTPTLIIHGEADERCPIGQGEQMFISLKKLGVETEFVRYPGGFHGFVSNGEPAHRLDVLTRTLAWYKRFLGDPV
jgi:dipeptidyl aminopeptidase/acylaminoacyl peptidase